MSGHVLCLVCKYFHFVRIFKLAGMKQPNNPLFKIALTHKRYRKIAIKSMTVAFCEVNLQSEHVCHVAKVKATRPAHSMATQYLYSVFLFLKTVSQGEEL